MDAITLSNRNGESRTVRAYDPIWNVIASCRMRFVRQLPDGRIEVADNNGRTLPERWRPENLRAF